MSENGRVTTREFYQELKEMRKELAGYHEVVVTLNERVLNHRTDISALKKHGNRNDFINGIGAVVAIVWTTITRQN